MHRVLGALACLLTGSCAQPSTTTFFVAPNGDDGGSGTSTRPFATLARARDAVRAVNRGDRDYAIVLRGGPYRLDTPLTLDARDSGGDGHVVTWRAADGETPVLSGGIPATSSNVAAARQLYVDGERVSRRRDPVTDAIAFADGDDEAASAGYHFAQAPSWAGPSMAELGWLDTWSHKVCPVAHVETTADGGLDVVVAQPCFYLISHDPSGRALPAPAYAESRFTAVPPGTEVIAPVLEQLLIVGGSLDAPARNLAFVGLTFAHAAWQRPSDEGLADVQDGFVVDLRDPAEVLVSGAIVSDIHNELRKPDAAVVVDAVTNVTFDACHFTHLGAAALSVQHGTRDVIVENSTFDDVSANAVQVGDVLREDHHPSDARATLVGNVVRGNDIHDIGVEFQDSVAVFVGYTDSTTVAANRIDAIPYSGISVGWGWGEEDPGGGATTQPFSFTTPTTARNNVVTDNTLSNVMQLRSDGAAIYTLGAQPGTVIENNTIRGAIGWPGGIYLDEGTRGVTVSSNDVTDVPLPFFDHSGAN